MPLACLRQTANSRSMTHVPFTFPLAGRWLNEASQRLVRNYHVRTIYSIAILICLTGKVILPLREIVSTTPSNLRFNNPVFSGINFVLLAGGQREEKGKGL